MYDVIIIGGGVSGLSAAIYAGRLNLKTLVIGQNIGGTIQLTTSIENYPPFKSISGLDLAQQFREMAEKYNVEIIETKVSEIKHNESFTVSANNKKYTSKTVIFATGTDWKKLEVPGAKEFENKGVHFCALCDGALYKDKVCAVVGGSDSAIREASILSQYAKKIYIIARRDELTAEPINLKKIKENKKIEIITNTNVKQIIGTKFVEKILLDKKYKGSFELPVSAVFVAIGHIALSGLAKNLGVIVNEKNELIIDRECRTNINGFFAAGDVTDTLFKQAIIGVSQGVIAAHSAYEYIKTFK